MSKEKKVEVKKVKPQSNNKRGLHDKELVEKYEAGSIDLKQALKPLLDNAKN